MGGQTGFALDAPAQGRVCALGKPPPPRALTSSRRPAASILMPGHAWWVAGRLGWAVMEVLVARKGMQWIV